MQYGVNGWVWTSPVNTQAFEELVAEVEAGNGPVLAITHGGFIKTLLRLVAGTDAICFRVYNAGVNGIE